MWVEKWEVVVICGIMFMVIIIPSLIQLFAVRKQSLELEKEMVAIDGLESYPVTVVAASSNLVAPVC